MERSQNFTQKNQEKVSNNDLSFNAFCLANIEHQKEIIKRYMLTKQTNRKYSFSYVCYSESSDEEVAPNNKIDNNSNNTLEDQKFKNIDKKGVENQSEFNQNEKYLILRNNNIKSFQHKIQQKPKQRVPIKELNTKVQKHTVNKRKEDLWFNKSKKKFPIDEVYNQEKDKTYPEQSIVFQKQDVDYSKNNTGKKNIQKNDNEKDQKHSKKVTFDNVNCFQQLNCNQEGNLNFDDFQFKPKSLFNVSKSKLQAAQKILEETKNDDKSFVNFKPKSLFDVDIERQKQAQNLLENIDTKEQSQSQSYIKKSKDINDFQFQPKSLFNVDQEKLDQAQDMFRKFEIENQQEKSKKYIKKDNLQDKYQTENDINLEKQKNEDLFKDFVFKPKSLFEVDENRLEKAKELLKNTQTLEKIQTQIQNDYHVQQLSQNPNYVKQENNLQKKVLNIKKLQQNSQSSQKKVKKFASKEQHNQNDITSKIKKMSNQKLLLFLKNDTEYDLQYLNNNKQKQKYIPISGCIVGLFTEKLNYLFESFHKFSFEWVNNHLRLIRYKCYFKNIREEAEIIKTIHEELVYRYWREQSQDFQSSVKQVVNMEGYINKQLILMILYIKIKKDYIQIEFTDGWYSIYMKIQKNNKKENIEFLHLVKQGKIYPTKLVQIQNFKFKNKFESLYKRNYFIVDSNNFFPAKNQPLGFKFSQMKPLKFENIQKVKSIISLIDAVVIKKSLNFVKFDNQQEPIQLTNEEDIQEYLQENKNFIESIPSFYFCIDIVQYPLSNDNKIYTIYFSNVNFQYYEYLELYQRFQFKSIKQILKNTSDTILFNDQQTYDYSYFHFQSKSQIQIKQMPKEEKKIYIQRYKSQDQSNLLITYLKNFSIKQIYIKNMTCTLVYLKYIGKNCVMFLFFLEPSYYFYFLAKKHKYQFVCQQQNLGKEFELSEILMKNRKQQKIDGQCILYTKLNWNQYTGVKIKSQNKQQYAKLYKKIKTQIEHILKETNQNNIYYLTNQNLKYNL